MVPEPAPGPTPDRQRAAGELAHHRLEAALYAQAPLTVAAMNALADAEFILRNAENLGSP
ncbi:hypothetical protein EDD27_3549 [Nonomuraea polychroma]|uniref:Uncharacterized protein n=1 Tax=Nonomuraea polychroma TaxID=46176 RepID=A0A438M5F5_9ACTN|nr:hypothetical protein [Nonomuraea polychroma]RVX41086.1 hypothetical protein EDD27_3549 [Nonomuraea polychroma]